MRDRISFFDERLSATVISEDDLDDKWVPGDVVLALSCHQPSTVSILKSILNKDTRTGARPDLPSAVLARACSSELESLQFVGPYLTSPEALGKGGMVPALHGAIPWSKVAQGKRLMEQAEVLLGRHSSEDLLYALFFVIHARVLPLELVQYSVNPSWDKSLWGVPGLKNAQEFAKMLRCCGPKIFAALGDPTTKKAIDLLNAVDLRDQVGSYRVIVSFETPLLEDFSLCILQQHNCFNCDAKIIDRPKVPVLSTWRGSPLSPEASRQILRGHFRQSHDRRGDDAQDPEAAAAASGEGEAWSWKVVCGANPAYDAFPAQHQIFYPSEKNPSHLWYDPVFKVDTVDGREVWCKRHYKCTPREEKTTPGLWTFTTLDNGVGSRELWTIVDAADDLEWTVLHYTGAAARAGSSYVGALLCSRDGQWPPSAASGEGLERIAEAFRKCGLELWELYGHGPPDDGRGGSSFMWSDEHVAWAGHHPPPLDPIGDLTVQAWRAQERAKTAAAAGDKA